MPLAPPLAHLIETKLAHTVAAQWELPIGAVRDSFAKLWTPALTGEPIALADVDERTVAGHVPLRLYRPHADGRPSLLMYFHGGGWVKGGLAETDAFCRRLAHSTGRITISVAYRLAPEHPFPAALDDVLAATNWVYAHAAELGGSADGFAVCGESAGGNLAAVVALIGRTLDSVTIARQILLQPVTDLTLSFPSIAMPETKCLVPRADLAWYYRQYAGTGADPREARLSPLWAADLGGLPPALIIAAEYDSLRDEAEAYAQRLEAAGVEVHYRCYPGMVHGFLQMAGLVADAQRAIDEIAAFLRS